MTSREIYKRFVIKINKNDTNKGINILPSNFVLLFNTHRLLWLGEKLKSSDVDVTNVQEVFKPNVKLKLVRKYKDSVEYELPKDIYRYAGSFSIADRGECKGKRIFNYEKKPLLLNTVLADDYNSPAFDYEEAPCIQTENKLKVYFDDFEIKNVYLSYYKTPIAIDLANATHFDGSKGKNQDTELSDQNIDEILNRMAVEVLGPQNQNAEGFTFAKDRINSEP